jgi:RNA polymerase sigma factor (sigma-70 family)
LAENTAAVLKRAIRSVAAEAGRAGLSDRELLHCFAGANDQEAFAALVRRYTSMVLGVCRRALGNVQDAEDACQATFVVLARKAKAGRWQPSVANWLYTTARRVASNARLAAQRRARREACAALPEAVPPADSVSGRELLEALDEELGRLPPRYREPLVLCYLDGLSRDEAAARLGAPVGTVKVRLERGRKKLGEALARRGCGLGAGLLAVATSSPAASGSPLVRATLRAAGGHASPAVASLAEEAMRMVGVRQALAASVLLVALLSAAVGPLLPRSAGGDKPTAAAPEKTRAESRPKAKAPVEKKRAPRTVTGVVLGPDGRPVKGCRVYLCPRFKDKEVARAEVAADGTFRLSFDTGELPGDEEEAWRDGRLIATAPGHGPAWARLGDVAHAGWKARLASDQVVEGRLTTLEGKPVAGASIVLGSLEDWSAAGRLDEYLTAVSKNTRRPIAPSSWWGTVPGQRQGWKTDAQGRYRVTGLGRDRVANLRVSGPGVARTTLRVVTRPGKVVHGRGNDRSEGPVMLLPARHEFSLAPGRTIFGVVKEEGSGRPVEGMRIALGGYGPEVVTGPDGRFELRGVPKKARHTLYAFPTEKAATFINAELKLTAEAPGLADERVEFTVRRGIPLRVKVIDKATGKPETGDVWCSPVYPNREVPATLASHHLVFFRQADGSYLGAALPGPGAVTVRRRDGRYLPATASQKAFFKLDRMPNLDYGGSEDDVWLAGFGRFAPIPAPVRQFQAVTFINPAKGTKGLSLTLELLRGQAKLLRFSDGRGAPVKGVRWKEDVQAAWSDPLPKAELQVTGVGPGRSRLRLLRQEEQKLAGKVEVKADSPATLTVVLRPWGTLTGRVLDKGGKPVPFARLFGLPEVVRTDAKGRFRAEGLAAEVEHTVHVESGGILIGRLPETVRLRAGEVKDLGDVRARSLGG